MVMLDPVGFLGKPRFPAWLALPSVFGRRLIASVACNAGFGGENMSRADSGGHGSPMIPPGADSRADEHDQADQHQPTGSARFLRGACDHASADHGCA